MIRKENEVTEETFLMTKAEINFVEKIQWEIYPTER